jgi:hypothetical protein
VFCIKKTSYIVFPKVKKGYQECTLEILLDIRFTKTENIIEDIDRSSPL